MFYVTGVWHHPGVSWKLRIVSACAASSLLPLVASGIVTVPTIAVTESERGSEAAHVMFSPPAITRSATAEQPAPRFLVGAVKADEPSPEERGIGGSLTPAATPVAPEVAATKMNPPPAVAFAAPRYTPPPPPASPRYQTTRTERETLAACLVLEAASQGDYGMRAVMSVIRNRADGVPERFLSTVLQPKQFSALNNVTAGRESLRSAINRAKRDHVWPTALAIVDDALQDTWHDPTGGATHYTRSGERTHWTRRLAKTTTIGAHSFYR